MTSCDGAMGSFWKSLECHRGRPNFATNQNWFCKLSYDMNWVYAIKIYQEPDLNHCNGYRSTSDKDVCIKTSSISSLMGFSLSMQMPRSADLHVAHNLAVLESGLRIRSKNHFHNDDGDDVPVGSAGHAVYHKQLFFDVFGKTVWIPTPANVSHLL